MTSSHEDSTHYLADRGDPSGDIMLSNFVVRLNQLAEIIGDQPVLTMEITERLGQDARCLASQGIDLSKTSKTVAISERLKPLGQSSEAFKSLVLRNLAALYWEFTKDDEDAPPELPRDVLENLGQLALYLAGEGVDLSEAPDIDEEEGGSRLIDRQ
jgi:hypothetical protein